MNKERRGHEYDRNYVITQIWTGTWQGSCDRCGESNQHGSLASVFALLWKHRDCEGPTLVGGES